MGEEDESHCFEGLHAVANSARQIRSNCIDDPLGDTLHAKRIESLANGAIGVIAGGSLGVTAIGQALKEVRDLSPKHAVEQVDRLPSNEGIVIWDLFDSWVGRMVGARKEARDRLTNDAVAELLAHVEKGRSFSLPEALFLHLYEMVKIDCPTASSKRIIHNCCTAISGRTWSLLRDRC
jgi:hypothetical protein